MGIRHSLGNQPWQGQCAARWREPPPLSPQADITTSIHRNVLLPTDLSFPTCFTPAALHLLHQSRRGSLCSPFSSQKLDREQGHRERCMMPRQVMPRTRTQPRIPALSPVGLGLCLKAWLLSRRSASLQVRKCHPWDVGWSGSNCG